jgi:hypothetical protein
MILYLTMDRREIHFVMYKMDRLCGLVVGVLGYRSGGLDSIPGTTRKKKVVGLERVHSASLSTKQRSCLIEK